MNERDAAELAHWMSDGGHGTWPDGTEEERAALVDAYMSIISG